MRAIMGRRSGKLGTGLIRAIGGSMYGLEAFGESMGLEAQDARLEWRGYNNVQSRCILDDTGCLTTLPACGILWK
jgi:hypothetical protein